MDASPPMAGVPTPISILHVVECYEAGVGRALDTIVSRRIPGVVHHLIWDGADVPPDSVFVTSERLPIGMLARARRVRQRAAELDATLIHAHSSWAGVYARILKPRVPVIYQPHGYKFEDEQAPVILRTIFRFVERVLARRTRTTVALSPHEAEIARSLDTSGRVEIVANVSTIPDSARRQCVRLEPHLFMVGRIASQKDPAYFIELFSRLRVRHGDLSATWVGDGDPGARRALQLAGVRVSGWLSRDDLAAELAHPGVYVHTARYEGFPLSVLDAIATGHLTVARMIPAFEGCPLETRPTLEELVELVSGLVDEQEVLVRKVRLAGHALLNEMNESRQSNALAKLYGAAESGVSC